MDKTLAIPHTPAGSGGIAVILLVGPAAREVLHKVFTPARRRDLPANLPASAPPLLYGHVHEDGQRLDEAIVAVWPGDPGDDSAEPAGVVEINVHGGPRVVQRLLLALERAGAAVSAAGALPASAGGWLLSAPGRNNPAIGRELLECLPEVRTRAGLAWLTHQWSAGLSELAKRAMVRPHDPSLPAALRDAAGRLGLMRRLLTRAEVVIAGPPNAGKSTLANALIGRQACIVSDAAGTTRDWVRELADVDGLPVWLTDTAGLWESSDPIAAAAVARAWQRIDQADLVLAVADSANPPPPGHPAWTKLAGRPNAVLVTNKSDLAPPAPTA